ncbi:MAG: preprotein translocase subunit YajC [Zoogloeaceae bacterium]|nr:preprotein translocase subunit YajC [Zoogloeaceae bacterium]
MFMISLAYAQEAAAAVAQPSFFDYLPLIALFIAIWFLMLRPQMKRAKEHKLLVDGLQKGDEVVTQGGIAGRILKVGEVYVTVEISSGVETIVQKNAITLALPKGTLKEAR